eukprot:403360554
MEQLSKWKVDQKSFHIQNRSQTQVNQSHIGGGINGGNSKTSSKNTFYMYSNNPNNQSGVGNQQKNQKFNQHITHLKKESVFDELIYKHSYQSPQNNSQFQSKKVSVQLNKFNQTVKNGQNANGKKQFNITDDLNSFDLRDGQNNQTQEMYGMDPPINDKQQNKSPKSKISASAILRMPIVQQDIKTTNNSPYKNLTGRSAFNDAKGGGVANQGNEQVLTTLSYKEGGMTNNSYRAINQNQEMNQEQQKKLLRIVEDYNQDQLSQIQKLQGLRNALNNIPQNTLSQEVNYQLNNIDQFMKLNQDLKQELQFENGKLVNFTKYIQSNNQKDQLDKFPQNRLNSTGAATSYHPIHSKKAISPQSFNQNNYHQGSLINHFNTQRKSAVEASITKRQDYYNNHSKHSSTDQIPVSADSGQWITSNMLRTRGKKMPFYHWNADAQKVKVKTSPRVVNENQLLSKEVKMKDTTTSPPQELMSPQLCKERQEDTRLFIGKGNQDFKGTSIENNQQVELTNHNNDEPSPMNQDSDPSPHNGRDDSQSSIADLKKGDLKTLDSTKYDEELAMIRRIYDNFNKHSLPIKQYNEKHIEKNEGFNQTQETKTNLYKRYKNRKYLFKDEIYLNQDSEQSKKLNLENFYRQRDISNKDKYIEFLKHKLKLASDNYDHNKIEIFIKDHSNNQKFQKISYLITDSNETNQIHSQPEVFNRFQDLNRFKNLLSFGSDSKVRKSEITQMNKNELLQKIRQKITKDSNDQQLVLAYDINSVKPLTSTHQRAQSQLMNLRSVAYQNDDPDNYLDYLANKRLVLPALGDEMQGQLECGKANQVLINSEMETFDKPIQNQFDLKELESKAFDGSSYNKITSQNINLQRTQRFNSTMSHNLYPRSSQKRRQVSTAYNNDDPEIKLKISANVDFRNDKMDLNILKRPIMRNRKEERNRLLGQTFNIQREKQKQHDIALDIKRRELDMLLSRM